ncbi:MAG: LytR C-terminal domain-containing protein, partial [Acidimicrobiales bacterium]
MTTARGPGRPPQRGGPRAHGSTSLGKGLAVTVVALAIGVYLLQLGGGAPAAPAAVSVPTTTTTTTAPATPSSTTTTAPGAGAPSAAVKVLVANASETTGVAGYYSTTLGNDGWGTLTATDALTVESTSVVAYEPGQQASAEDIATELGLPSSAVEAVSAATPVEVTASADVVVVVGVD